MYPGASSSAVRLMRYCTPRHPAIAGNFGRTHALQPDGEGRSSGLGRGAVTRQSAGWLVQAACAGRRRLHATIRS